MQPLTDTTFNAPQREPTAVSHTHYCIVGDVSVDASAAIAPGVVLQALSGSRIVIGSGACLAGGVCLQAKAGLLTISPGATLGANVLVVGSGRVGANACVSPGSTLLNPQVEDNALLPPNTLLDKTPKQKTATYTTDNGAANSAGASNAYAPATYSSVSATNQDLPKNTFVEPGPIEPKPVQIPTIDVTASPASYDPSKNGVQLNQKYDLSNGNNQPTSHQSSAITAPAHDRVYGRNQVSELISTLFPNRQSLNGN